MKKKVKDLIEEAIVVLFLALGVYALFVFGINTNIPVILKVVFFIAMIQWCAPLVHSFERFSKELSGILSELGGKYYEKHI